MTSELKEESSRSDENSPHRPYSFSTTVAGRSIPQGIHAEMHERHLELRRVVTLLNTLYRIINSFSPEGEQENSPRCFRIKPRGSFNSFIRYTDINARSFYRYILRFTQLWFQQKDKNLLRRCFHLSVSDNFCQSNVFSTLFTSHWHTAAYHPIISFPHLDTSRGSSLVAVVKHWPVLISPSTAPVPPFYKSFPLNGLNRDQSVFLVESFSRYYIKSSSVEETEIWRQSEKLTEEKQKPTNWQRMKERMARGRAVDKEDCRRGLIIGELLSVCSIIWRAAGRGRISGKLLGELENSEKSQIHTAVSRHRRESQRP